jgi:adenylate kinase
MRALVTGQVGLDKKQYLQEVTRLAAAQGEAVHVYNLGDMMYREAPDVPAGRILDLPLARLNSLRRAVMRDVLADMGNHKHVIVNTHALFRWKHGLFSAFDFDQLAQFNADLYVTLVDNIEVVHARMLRDHEFEHSLKDLMVWREEEILATEIVAKANARRAAEAAKFFVLSRGRHVMTAETLYRLIFRPNMKTVYPSFPMSHVMDMPEVLAEINAFRAKIAERMIAFDPGDVDEKVLSDRAIRAASEGKLSLEVMIQEANPSPPPAVPAAGGSPPPPPPAPANALQLKVQDILQIVPDIDGQIYARDFTLVRQSDMIVSYIPELPGGKPGLSSGVERELQHAHEHGKDVFVIWKPKKEPSPFVTQTANKVFRGVEEALGYFERKGYFQPFSLFGA